MMTIQDLLDLSKTIAAPLFAGKTYPWEALAEIGDFILQLGPTLPAEEYEQRGENIWIARDAKIFDSAYIAGPCIIDHGAELRQCAFVRGNAIVGKKLYVTLGQFSIIRLERDTQLLIPAYDYCMPDKACQGSTEDDPCSMFSRIHFPIDEFFPPDCVTPDEDYRSLL